MRLHSAFASSRASPLKGHLTVEVRIIILHSLIAQVQIRADTFRQTRSTMLEQGIVMSASGSVSCLVDDQSFLVDCYLGFHSVFFPLAAIMRFTFKLDFGPWNLLLRGVYGGFEAWERCFNFLDGLESLDFVVVAKSDFEWRKISEELRRLKTKPNCQGNSVIKAFLPCHSGLFQVDFYRAQPSTFGIHLLVRTGSAEHNMWLAGYAISKGKRIKHSEGLIKDGVAVAGETEQGVFEALGLPCPLPTEREISDGKPVWMPPERL